MNLHVKRVYDRPERTDGCRILVDRMWPRGLTKENAKIDLWLKEVAPGIELRKWFSHDPEKWPVFRDRYFGELKEKHELTELIRSKAKKGPVTLVYAAKNEKYNNAVCLWDFLVHSK
jgi:uncharacterized protein YeaO (DUF488 family)